VQRWPRAARQAEILLSHHKGNFFSNWSVSTVAITNLVLRVAIFRCRLLARFDESLGFPVLLAHEFDDTLQLHGCPVSHAKSAQAKETKEI